MNETILQTIREHAAAVAPSECCGLIVSRDGVEEYRPCNNIASNPTERFAIAPEDYAAAEDDGVITAIVHSHVYLAPEPSEADRAGCERSGLPWLIVNHPLGHYTITKPVGYRPPLIGRPFCKGSLDCYALVRDYFHEELKIDLPDYERPEVWAEVGRSILLENFEGCGFKEIDISELQPNDCFLMQVAASVPNHCAVYVGDNQILHHVFGRLSGRDVFGEFWRKHTVKCLRYVK